MSGLTSIVTLFQLPQEDANGQELEETGEENGKEDKEIDMGLVLAEKQIAISLINLTTASPMKH